MSKFYASHLQAAVMIENLQKSYEINREEAANKLTQLQIDNKKLLADLASIQTTASSSSGVAEAAKSSMEILQKSLIQSETELAELRKLYKEVSTEKMPRMQADLDAANRQIADLHKEKESMTSQLAAKDEEVEMWKKKFAIQEKERDTLIEGWKDIVQTAGSSKSSLSGTKSSKSDTMKKVWR